MRTTTIARLHHNAWVTRDQEATRRFYEDLIGLPLVATWSETDELFGAERVYCHTFFGLADGSALAFFQFADPNDQELFGPTMPESPFSHIALKVDHDTQDEVARLPRTCDLRARARILQVAVRQRSQRSAGRAHR
jgi:glyoxylase I family protein